MEMNNKKITFLKYFSCALIIVVFAIVLFINYARYNMVYAANVNTGVTGLTADSSGNATWSYNSTNRTISGSVKASSKSGCTGTTYTEQSGKLTFKNSSGEERLVSFDYTISLNGGSCTFNPNIGSTNSYSKVLAANETIEITITSNASNSNATTITISNISSISTSIEYSIGFFVPEGCTLKFNNEIVNTGDFKTVTPADEITLITTVSDSTKKFFNYYNYTNNDSLGVTATLKINFSDSITVGVSLTDVDSPIFECNSKMFDDLNLANAEAVQSGDSKIVLVADGIIKNSTCTLSSGKMLLVPFDEARTVYTDDPEVVYGSHANPSAYKTLTLNNSTINVSSNASICLPCKMSATGTNTGSWNGTTTGNYGHIILDSESKIVLNNGSKLYCWGYISGTGVVEAESGSTVYEMFQNRCWRGGTATSGMAGNSQKVFPFTQYYVQNIECTLKVESGATEYVRTAVNMSSKAYKSGLTIFIGKNRGMFNIVDGYIEKKYEGSTDRLIITVDGELSMSPMTVTVTGLPLIGSINLDTSDYVLPINSNITINVNSGSKINISQDVALLPGSIIRIEKNAELLITSGKKLYVYDKDEWGNYGAGGAQLVVVGYSTVNGTTAKRTAASLVDAKIVVNGVMTFEGDLYTTVSGANICSEIVSSDGKNGKVVFATKSGTDSKTYQATQSGSDITYVDISINSAMFKHGDGTYLEIPSGGFAAGTEFYYHAGKWDTKPIVFKYHIYFYENENSIGTGNYIDYQYDSSITNSNFPTTNDALSAFGYDSEVQILKMWFLRDYEIMLVPGINPEDNTYAMPSPQEFQVTDLEADFPDDNIVYAYAFYGGLLKQGNYTYGYCYDVDKSFDDSLVTGIYAFKNNSNVYVNYMFNSDGYLVTGNSVDQAYGLATNTKDGLKYYISASGVVESIGLIQLDDIEEQGSDNKKYYFYFGDNNYAYKSGYYYVNSTIDSIKSGYYYFDEYSHLVENPEIEIINNKCYIAGMVTCYGLFELNGNRYYAYEDGTLATNVTLYVTSSKNKTGNNAYDNVLLYFNAQGENTNPYLVS